MDKFYVTPKKNLVSGTPSLTKNAADYRKSSEIFQTTSNGRRLGVGNIYSKIRHKIEDNLTPKISGKLYKTVKTSKSLTALNSIGVSTGKYTLTANEDSVETARTYTAECRRAIPRSNNDGNNKTHNIYAECYNNSSLNPYVESDEDEEAQLSLNIAKTSLEDEIFEELEKVSHDENKLMSVLKTFDQIILDYNDPEIQLNTISNINSDNMEMKTDKTGSKNYQTANEHDDQNLLCDTDKSLEITCNQGSSTSTECLKSEQTDFPLQLERNTTECQELKKALSTLSLTRRKCYQSPDSPCLRQMRYAFAQQQKSKSVWELSNATKIPILKSIPLRTRSKSFCYHNSNRSSYFQNQNSLKKSIPPLVNTNDEPESVQSLSSRNKNHRSRDNLNNQVSSNTPTKTRNSPKSESIALANKNSLPAKNLSNKSKTPTPTVSQNPNLTSNPHMFLSHHSKTSDELLDKCIEKGQQILRKVESLKPPRTQISSYSRKALMRVKSNSSNRILKENLTLKRKQWLQKLNYANEEKISAPPLELCKIIPPILGETSDKHAELLVQVSNATHLNANKQRIISEESKSAISQVKASNPDLITKSQESDSDDSGHISNENMEISINRDTSNSSSSTSLSEEASSISSTSPSSSLRDNSSSNCIVTKSLKMSEVLRKFERKAMNQSHSNLLKNKNNTPNTSTNMNNIQTKTKPSGESSKNFIDSRFCTTCRVAQVESVSVIRTHLEIYPNYTKEVTIRLH